MPVFATAPLTVSGTSYETGEVIPWKEIKVSQRIVESWFRHRRISHFKDGDQSPEAKVYYTTGKLPGQATPTKKLFKKS